MTAYDFLSIYFPQASELDAARTLQMRYALNTLLQAAVPGVDTSPNSPFGDLFVSPMAAGMQAREMSDNRFLSDLDPTNTEAGVTYNCDFVRQFLLNFGVQDESSQQSYGIIRLLFSDSSVRDIDRSVTFQIGDGIYRPFTPYAGTLELLPPGTSGTAGTNWKNYAFYGPGEWAVDILVFGPAGQSAVAGDGVALDRTIDGLTGAGALGNIAGGASPTRLQELAKRVRTNFHSRTPTTRGGATNMITQQFPEITLTGCVISGDAEQLRDVVNPLQVAAGRIDIMVRGETLLTDTVTVRLRQMQGPDDSAGLGLVYAGWMDLPETPLRLVSFSNSGLFFDPTIYSVSTDPLKPCLTAAYGIAERLFVSAPYTTDELGNPAIATGVDATGVYADFAVSYLFDPVLKECQEFLASEENTPAGVDVYLRWFVPVVVAALTVDYNRKAGVDFNLASARADILSSYNTHTFATPSGPAAVEAAIYYAGGHSTNQVLLESSICYSVASEVWVGPGEMVAPTDAASWDVFRAGCVEVPVTAVTSAYAPDFSFLDTIYPTLAVSGDRNVSYILSSSNLALVERRSI